jgi:hypothetical protein
VRIYKTKEFCRFVRKQKISDEKLCEAVERAENSLIDADLGSGLIKQRVARPGQGRSGGYRTVIAFRARDRSIFLYGFAKSSKANLNDKELAVYKKLASAYLAANMTDLNDLASDGELIEVDCNGD